MYVGAFAIVALLMREENSGELPDRMANGDARQMSPVSVFASRLPFAAESCL